MTLDPIRAALERLIELDDNCGSADHWYAAIAAARAALAAAPVGEGDERIGSPEGEARALARAIDEVAKGWHPQACLLGNVTAKQFRRTAALLRQYWLSLGRQHRLQQENHRFREPERTILCDILANGTLLPDPDGTRYGIPATPPAAPDDRGVLPLIVSETGAGDEPEIERITCRWISGGADYVNNMPRGLGLERTTPEGSIIADYVQSDISPIRPAAPPAPLEGEVGELVEELGDIADAYDRVGAGDEEAAMCRRAAALLKQLAAPAPAVVPVAVSERLPEPNTKVLAHYFNCLGKGRTICAIWVPAKSRSDDADFADEDFTEYDEETDKFYWPEGWYEQIENWDDLGWVKVNEGEVVYWQPLPKWPAPALPLPAPQDGEDRHG